MKQVKRLALILILLVVTTNFANAQSKVAHIDVQKLLSEMPEMKAAESELKKLYETYQADIQGAMTELRNKFTQYNNEAPNKTKEENDKRATELQGQEKTIAEAQQKAQEEIQKKRAELFAPISEKAKAAIEKVAAANGFDYVIDALPGGPVVVAKGKDLLADVKKELGY